MVLYFATPIPRTGSTRSAGTGEKAPSAKTQSPTASPRQPRCGPSFEGQRLWQLRCPISSPIGWPLPPLRSPLSLMPQPNRARVTGVYSAHHEEVGEHLASHTTATCSFSHVAPWPMPEGAPLLLRYLCKCVLGALIRPCLGLFISNVLNGVNEGCDFAFTCIEVDPRPEARCSEHGEIEVELYRLW